MKHIRTFENYRVRKNRDEIIKEAVLQVNDVYKVKTMIDIPQSLINAYVKKVKDTTGKNLKQFFGDVDIAEEIVKYINTNNLNVDNIPGGALMGGQAQEETQTQVQPQAQTQMQTQVQPQGQEEMQTQAQGQAQPQGQEETQVQVQTQGQGQAQPQGQEEIQFEEPQGQGQAQPQGQAQGEEETEEGEEETGEEETGEEETGEEETGEEETGEEELPL
jgi:cobalamin biosynthesis protein CobT